MYTISNMIAIFVDLAAFQMPMALMFYLIVWFATNKKDGQKIKIKGWWHILGVFVASCIGGLLRFISIFIVGGKVALSQQGGSTYEMLFLIVFSPIIAIITVSLIKSIARRLD